MESLLSDFFYVELVHLYQSVKKKSACEVNIHPVGREALEGELVGAESVAD